MPDPALQPHTSAHVALVTTEPTSVGYGFISGLLSAILGIAGLALVLSLRFPEYLPFGDLRRCMRLRYLRAVIHVTLVTSFLLGSVSAFLRANKALAFTGIGFTLSAALLGGSQVPVDGAESGERLLAGGRFLRAESPALLGRLHPARAALRAPRRSARVPPALAGRPDLLLHQFAADRGADDLHAQAGADPLRLGPRGVGERGGRVAPAPRAGAVPRLVADFTQYWVHRTFHAVPFLWRFHAIHHSVEEMDWLAGSRLHLVDVIVTRGLTYVPIFVLGFSNAALMVYVFLVAAQATFIHANVRWQFRPVRRLVATPAFHHWHHSADTRGRRTRTSRCTRRLGHPVRHLLPSGQLADPLRPQRPSGRSVRLVEAAAVPHHQTPSGLTALILSSRHADAVVERGLHGRIIAAGLDCFRGTTISHPVHHESACLPAVVRQCRHSHPPRRTPFQSTPALAAR